MKVYRNGQLMPKDQWGYDEKRGCIYFIQPIDKPKKWWQFWKKKKRPVQVITMSDKVTIEP